MTRSASARVAAKPTSRSRSRCRCSSTPSGSSSAKPGSSSMTARVLVVDDVDANVKLLEARLTADYFEVRTARSGREALEICAQRARRCGAARRDDAGHGRFRGLPAAEIRAAHPAYSGDHGHRARSSLGQGEGARGGRRRLPHQAGGRHRAGHAGQESRAAQDADRRDADARLDRGADGPRRDGWLTLSTRSAAGAAFLWSRTRTAPSSGSRARSKASSRWCKRPIRPAP